jgi:2-amino-4-hydroxy-6-hydroxymethyldihydropteridine diphosphokinase
VNEGGRRIFLGIGANLPSQAGSPRETCEAALTRLEVLGVRVIAPSRWYRSAPLPPSDQPWFVNGVVEVAWAGTPEALLAALHEVEAALGRARRVRDEARVIDLDLLAFGDEVRTTAPILPHPRMHERGFVLLPLAEIAPGWRHPVSGHTVEDMIAALPPGQVTEPIPVALAPEAGERL